MFETLHLDSKQGRTQGEMHTLSLRMLRIFRSVEQYGKSIVDINVVATFIDFVDTSFCNVEQPSP